MRLLLLCGSRAGFVGVGKRGTFLRVLVFSAALGGAAGPLSAATAVFLSADPPGPSAVGTMVAWSARVDEAPSSDLWYRFRVREAGGEFRTIRDYGPLSTLDWTALDEGDYEVELSVKQPGGPEIGTAVSALRMQSRALAGQLVVSPTSNPLVFLLSAPACESGSARVQFRLAGGTPRSTPEKPCQAASSLNFYLAGLLPRSSYSANLVVTDGRDETAGPAVTFTTGAADASVSGLINPPIGTLSAPEQILLEAPLHLPAVATDSGGNVLWYGPSDVTYMTRPGGDGTFYGIIDATDPAH